MISNFVKVRQPFSGCLFSIVSAPVVIDEIGMIMRFRFGNASAAHRHVSALLGS
jgi:hypothetical protein